MLGTSYVFVAIALVAYLSGHHQICRFAQAVAAVLGFGFVISIIWVNHLFKMEAIEEARAAKPSLPKKDDEWLAKALTGERDLPTEESERDFFNDWTAGPKEK